MSCGQHDDIEKSPTYTLVGLDIALELGSHAHTPAGQRWALNPGFAFGNFVDCHGSIFHSE
jgi:hypothetical protein